MSVFNTLLFLSEELIYTHGYSYENSVGGTEAITTLAADERVSFSSIYYCHSPLPVSRLLSSEPLYNDSFGATLKLKLFLSPNALLAAR